MTYVKENGLIKNRNEKNTFGFLKHSFKICVLQSAKAKLWKVP